MNASFHNGDSGSSGVQLVWFWIPRWEIHSTLELVASENIKVHRGWSSPATFPFDKNSCNVFDTDRVIVSSDTGSIWLQLHCYDPLRYRWRLQRITDANEVRDYRV